ncbi:hypothetical protein CCO03_02660 [Comamonas serinivorans]|uniref:ABC transporter substrate-binding protein n=1 Tax=Comamonas serinivorans TaxID=1082851 RepID=A0A1Y0EJY1_9BURK|nr:tripartite tricarboxylate transporter substrate binding protein [Comamonas serinivorans]ARU03731.1 hypothetical protein CCO03_02660 [Comamonas serinivorans]
MHQPSSPPTSTALSRRHVLQGAGALGAGLAAPAVLANTDAFPKGPVRIIVTFAPGGATDTVGRLLADKLSKTMGITFIVENKPGAAGMIGTEQVAKATPDGQTFGLVLSGVVYTNPYIYTKVPYVVERDLALVYKVLNSSGIFTVHPSLPVNNFKELVALVKANPDKYSFGSFGQGSTPHMLCEYLRKTQNMRMNHVPYKGEAPMVQDLLANQVQIGYGSVAVQKQHIELGKLRAVGTVTPQRLEAMPDLPTLQEQGFPDEAFRMPSWFAIIAPKGVPKPLQDRLARELSKVMAMPDVKESITKMGYAAVSDSSPDKLMAEYREWAPKWKNLAELSGAKIDQ